MVLEKVPARDRQYLLLDLLKKQSLISGQTLAEQMQISRTAVWKMIKRLRRNGYAIDSIPGRGYTLQQVPDRLFPGEIQSELGTTCFARRIVYLPEVDSTQAKAKELADKGEPEGSLVLAETQTRGRGRLHRVWANLPGSVCLSIILRPSSSPEKASHFPLLAGVALARAVRRINPLLQPQLKWPNDLQLQGKKCAGILAEMAAEAERIHYIILGLGLNVNCSAAELDPSLKNRATSLHIESGAVVSRTRLVQTVLQELETLYADYQQQGFETIRQEWKTWSNTLGKQVRVQWSRKIQEGMALDIDGTGALIIQLANGRLSTVTAGDVSLRGMSE